MHVTMPDTVPEYPDNMGQRPTKFKYDLEGRRERKLTKAEKKRLKRERGRMPRYEA